MTSVSEIFSRASSAAVASRKAKPDVLVITSELPWPLNSGGHIRSFHILKALSEEFNVRVIAGAELADDPGLPALGRHGIRVIPAFQNKRNPISELGRVVSSLICEEPYVMFNRHKRPAMRQAIRKQLAKKTPDVVYLDHLDPLAFRGLFPRARIVADLHNVYSTLAKRVATERKFPVNLYLHNEARLLRYMEKQVAAAASVIMTVSETEQGYFQKLGGYNVRLVPNGVDCAAFNKYPIGRKHARPTLLYLGALSWQPNAKAAEFLARDVMPRILAERPDARLQIVGRNPGPEVTALAELPNVEVHANVPDVGHYLEQASILAVPLDSGGGTRLKILEAFAAGLPVISTPVGCEGIECRHGEHLWVAERDQFAEGLLAAIDAPQLVTEFAERGRRLAEETYDWSVIGKAACAAVAEVVQI
ncbi:MAG: glycosyltransferase [Rhodopirellula sp.]|nr:glycosyltransferase [Rhodopirellula sp.]